MEVSVSVFFLFDLVDFSAAVTADINAAALVGLVAVGAALVVS